MSLSLPVTWNVTIGNICHIRCLRASARNSRSPMIDLGDMRVAYEHAGELSQRMRADLWSTTAIYSNTSHLSNSAAISRSDLLRSPSGFFSLTSCKRTTSGHSTRHTVFEYAAVVLIHIPPAPILETSICPTSAIGCRTNSLT